MDLSPAEIKEIRENLPTCVVVKIFKKYWQTHDAYDHMKWLDRDFKKTPVKTFDRFKNLSEARALCATMENSIQYREFIRLSERAQFNYVHRWETVSDLQLADNDPLAIAVKTNCPLGQIPVKDELFFKNVGSSEMPEFPTYLTEKEYANGRGLPTEKKQINPRGFHMNWWNVMKELRQVVPLQDNGDLVQQDTFMGQGATYYGVKNRDFGNEPTAPHAPNGIFEHKAGSEHSDGNRFYHYWQQHWNRIIDYKRDGDTITWRWRKRKAGFPWFWQVTVPKAWNVPQPDEGLPFKQGLGSVKKSKAKFKDLHAVQRKKEGIPDPFIPDHGGF